MPDGDLDTVPLTDPDAALLTVADDDTVLVPVREVVEDLVPDAVPERVLVMVLDMLARVVRDTVGVRLPVVLPEAVMEAALVPDGGSDFVGVNDIVGVCDATDVGLGVAEGMSLQSINMTSRSLTLNAVGMATCSASLHDTSTMLLSATPPSVSLPQVKVPSGTSGYARTDKDESQSTATLMPVVQSTMTTVCRGQTTTTMESLT